MADLPTFTNLSDEQAQLLIQAYSPFEGATIEQVVDSYLIWLASQINGFVKAKMRAKIEASYQEQVKASDAQVAAILSPPPPPLQPEAVEQPPPVP